MEDRSPMTTSPIRDFIAYLSGVREIPVQGNDIANSLKQGARDVRTMNAFASPLESVVEVAMSLSDSGRVPTDIALRGLSLLAQVDYSEASKQLHRSYNFGGE